MAPLAESTYDVVVVGGGLSGASAARELARRGRSVLLVDRRTAPRDKVCGCCLNQAALSQLEAVGLGELPAKLGAIPLTRLRLLRGAREVRVQLPRGVAVSRRALDAALLESARQAGAEVREGVGGRVLPRLGSGQGRFAEFGEHRVRLSDGRVVAARVVVVADGLGGTSLKDWPTMSVRVEAASRIGLGGVTASAVADPQIVPGQIEMVCGRGGYLGAVCLEDGRVDFAAACDAQLLKQAGGVRQAVGRLAEQASASSDWPVAAVEDWRATPTLTRRRSRLAETGLFVVGDAAGYVEPFTGEGMAWALGSGVAVAPLADAAVEKATPQLAEAWEQTYRRRIARRQLGCRVVSQVLRRPRLVSAGLWGLSRWPGGGLPIIRRLTAPPRTGSAWRGGWRDVTGPAA